MVIVAASGVKIKCHKSFLMVQSYTLTTMLKDSPETANVCTLKLDWMTEPAVRAFLKYLYYADTTDSQESCDITVDVFKAGYLYSTRELEKVLKNMLLT